MLRNFIDFIFPQPCIICRKPLSSQEETFPACRECDKQIAYKYNAHPVFYLGEYKDSLQKLIHQLKYKKIKILGKYFSQKLVLLWNKFLFDKKIDIIISVPIHRRRLQERGYNQAHIIAYNLSKLVDIPYVKNLLKKIKYTESQTRLNREERLKNLRGSIIVKRKDILKNINHILLIDDIYTTGATSSECIRAIKSIKEDVKISVMVVAIA